MKLKKTNTSGYPGVSWHKDAGKWGAYIRLDGKRKHLGLFAKAEEAYAAYLRADAPRQEKYAERARLSRQELIAGIEKAYKSGGIEAVLTPALEKSGVLSKP